MTRSSWVATEALPALERRIDGLRRRAERLRAPAPELRVIGEQGARTLVELVGEAPRLNGWRIVAELRHAEAGTEVRPMPGERLPSRAWEKAPPRCEHCGLRRERKTTLLLRHRSGDLAQVGTACLADFTGDRDPLAAVALERAVAASASRARPDAAEVAQFLAAVAAEAREGGFVSRSQARDGQAATAELAAARVAKGGETSAEDRALGAAIERWVLHELARREGLRPYEQRLVSVFRRSERATERDQAMIASAWLAYEREREAEREHLAEVGERVEVEVVVEDVRRIERGSRFGEVWWHSLGDPAGHRLAWFAVGSRLEVGARYRLRGAVRRHDRFRGQAVTVLERCRVVDRMTARPRFARVQAVTPTARSRGSRDAGL